MSKNAEQIKSKKKHSLFRHQIDRPKIKQLLNCLTQTYDTHHCKLVQQIIEKRKQKINQLRRLKSKIIKHKPIKFSHSAQIFAQEKPISLEEQFMEYKYRANLLSPQRAFNNQPNMKAGSPKMINYNSNQDPRVINKKFQQYVRIVDQQSGVKRRKKFSQPSVSSDRTSLPQIKSPYKINMKKTYFKKYSSDQYNFYRPPIKQISRVQKIFDLTMQRQSTLNSRITEKSQLKSIASTSRPYHTLDIDLSRQQSKNQTRGAKTLDSYARA